jgi:hypothetical protein
VIPVGRVEAATRSLPVVVRALPVVVRALPILALLLPAAGCAARVPPAGTPEASATSPGYRALFRAEARRGGDRAKFRIAVTVQAPDRLRLEFFGPVGTARAVLVAGPDEVLVVAPGDRSYDRSPSGPAGLGRILGLPLGTAQVVALLLARPFCPPEALRDRLETEAAVTFARTIARHTFECPPGDLLYQGRGEDRGVVREAWIRDAGTGAIILRVEYDGDGGTNGWPSALRLQFEREGAEVVLKAEEGPMTAPVSATVFATTVPAGFERRNLSLSLTAPRLHGPAAEAGE